MPFHDLSLCFEIEIVELAFSTGHDFQYEAMALGSMKPL